MNGKPVFNVPTKTTVNFDSAFDKKLLCDGITFTAGSGCVYRCAFCYVPDMQRKSMDWMKDHGVKYGADGHLGVVIRTSDVVSKVRAQIMAKPEAFRRTKLVIYSSPKVDVAGNMELVKETVEICKVILECTDWDIRLLSKSTFLPKVAEALDYLEGEDEHYNPALRMIYGVSTGTFSDKIAAAFEEGTPKVSKRIQSLRWLQDNGFRTYGMVCPSLPDPAGYMQLAEDAASALRYDRVEHVWAEPINVRGESFGNMYDCLQRAGFTSIANAVLDVTNDKAKWEQYARDTFLAHARVVPPGKLRFLQYVKTDANRAWWSARVKEGAVLL